MRFVLVCEGALGEISRIDPRQNCCTSLSMSLLPRKSFIALAAVIDIGLTACPQPLNANALAARHRLPARYLESVLQRLVREGILDAKRGPQGGYTLGRDLPVTTVGDI